MKCSHFSFAKATWRCHRNGKAESSSVLFYFTYYMKKIYLTLLLALLSTLGVQANEYATIDGIRYELDANTNEATVTSNSPKYSGSITIPSTVTYNSKTYRVTTIDKYAFSNCSSLTSITIPNSVTTIGNKAFEYCSGLTSIKVETGNSQYV